MKIGKKSKFCKHYTNFSSIFLRQETNHIIKTVAFENAKLKILGENDQKYFTQTELKKGEKYQIQIDLEEELASNCKECIFDLKNRTGLKIVSKILGEDRAKKLQNFW